MASLLAFVLILPSWLALSSPIKTPALAACDADLPTWTVTNLKVTYGAEVQTGGRASWTFTNSVTNKSDALSCSLRANSHCDIVGTPSDKNTHIYLQISMDTALWLVNQTCASSPGIFLVGQTEMTLQCPDSPSGALTCTLDSGTIEAQPPGTFS